MMGKHYYYALIIAIIAILFFHSCSKKDDIANYNSTPYQTTPYELTIPTGFPQPVIPDFNPMTVEGVDLGRHLYYDPVLSSNGLTCSSCHFQTKSFSSPLFTSQTGEIKSVPPHINLAWNPDYNWNGSEPVLDHLCLGDFEPEFFNTIKDTLFARLINHKFYPNKFYRAFGVNNIGQLTYDELKQKIVYAISQFLRSMVTGNSKYAMFLRHEAMLTESEMKGFTIFSTEKGDCFHCHGSVLATDNNFHNTGLDSLPTGFNAGRYNVTNDPKDIGKFSSPTLLNIELTAPYMHDGRFQTLEEVIEYYNSGVHKTSPNIDPLMTLPGKLYGLELTPMQKNDLLNFLKTFTDTVFLNNPAYSNPF